MIEHRFTVESSTTSCRTQGENREVVRTRYVCSCGWATRWNKSPLTVRRERDRHALEGQLAHTLDRPAPATGDTSPADA